MIQQCSVDSIIWSIDRSCYDPLAVRIYRWRVVNNYFSATAAPSFKNTDLSRQIWRTLLCKVAGTRKRGWAGLALVNFWGFFESNLLIDASWSEEGRACNGHAWLESNSCRHSPAFWGTHCIMPLPLMLTVMVMTMMVLNNWLRFVRIKSGSTGADPAVAQRCP